jgi:hypothetical protein
MKYIISFGDELDFFAHWVGFSEPLYMHARMWNEDIKFENIGQLGEVEVEMVYNMSELFALGYKDIIYESIENFAYGESSKRSFVNIIVTGKDFYSFSFANPLFTYLDDKYSGLPNQRKIKFKAKVLDVHCMPNTNL